MEKKYILAGIPLVALLLTMIIPLVSIGAMGFSATGKLFDLFEDGTNVALALAIIAISLGVAFCAYTDKYMNIAPWLMLIPFVWILIWSPSVDGGILGSVSISANPAASAWIYLLLGIAEIVLVLKPDLLDNMLAKKQ